MLTKSRIRRMACVSSLVVGLLILGLHGTEPRTRLFEFTYKATLDKLPEGSEGVELWLPYPKSDEHQEIIDVQVKSPLPGIVYTEPEYGNQIFYISDRDALKLPLEVEISYKVLRKEYVRNNFSSVDRAPGSFLDPDISKYLKPTKLVPLTDTIRQWASEVTAGKKTDLEKARAIYDYVLANVKYDKNGKGWGNGDLLYVCDEKRGNCTDFHALFIGFARASGIPARFSIGFPLPVERGAGAVAGYHCWAEFYLKGYGWVPVDASEAWKNPDKRDYFFGAHDENRVQFSVGRDLILRPRQLDGPLNYFIYPYAEVSGKRLNNVNYQFSFRDLPEPSSAVSGN